MKHRVQVAAAAAIAERVSGIFSPLPGSDPAPLQRALALAWQYAEGSGIPPARIIEAREQLSAVIPDVERNPGKQAAMSAGVTALYALSAISDASPQSAARAFGAALDAVVSHAEDPDAAEEAEVAFQESTLEIAKSIGAKPVTRSAFMK